MTWDPVPDGEFRDEQSRPSFDLLARIPDRPYRRIADPRCGDEPRRSALDGRITASFRRLKR